MNATRNSQRPGLILLVVLGMLALFSMLAVTYVVFASQSRATSVALSRKDVRGNKSYQPLFEEAIKQLVRGSDNPAVATYGHSLLGDLYGDRDSKFITNPTQSNPAYRQAALLTIRNVEYNPSNPLQTSPMTYDSLQRPMLLGPSTNNSGGVLANGHYLRIPLTPGGYGDPSSSTFPINLPMEHDVLNGRIVTFPEGNGPLSGLSFRILRYIGRIAPFASPSLDEVIYFSQNYSITIDLQEADLSQIFAKYDAGLQQIKSLSLAEWVNSFPPGQSGAQAGVYACYGFVNDIQPHDLNGGFNLLLNAVPLNSHGMGIANNGDSQLVPITASGTVVSGSPIDNIASGLLPNQRFIDPTTAPTIPGLGPAGTLPSNSNFVVGDSDEPYDAPDAANFFLSFRQQGATASNQIIPSFHRAALINYIVNWKDPTTYTPQDLFATLRRIESACGRPLSINVTTPIGVYSTHPSFTGSNAFATPQLTFNVGGNWNSNWPTQGLPAFTQWVSWLIAGPWDVDNDADGLADSVWVDAGLPLQTSPDGQLLKAMVAYYVEDLDSKLDVNASSAYAQVDAQPPLSTPYPNNVSYTKPVDPTFAKFNGGNPVYLTQGVGYGSAESSFRHLLARAPAFGPPFFTTTTTPTEIQRKQIAFQQLLQSRYQNRGFMVDRAPGTVGNDASSHFRFREQRNVFDHFTLPGLPLGTHGRMAIGLDRLGNPRVWNVDSIWGQGIDEPYESRWLSAPFQDSPFTIAEWERIYRIGDGDRNALPQRLEDLFGQINGFSPANGTAAPLDPRNLRHEIAPRSSHLRVPILATRGTQTSLIPTSFLEVVNTIRQLRGATTLQMLDREVDRGFASLFPLEFQRGLPLDLNRPLGNGLDDEATQANPNGNGEIDESVELTNGQLALVNNPGPNSQTTTSTANSVPEEYRQGQIGTPGTNGTTNPSGSLLQNRSGTNLFDPDVDYTNTPLVFRHNLESRQLLARHLYCLAQLIVPLDYVFPNADPSLLYTLDANNKLPALTVAERGRILAQWAVNIVDFRDADSAMTRFPYDPDPMGWGPNSKLAVPNDQTSAYFAWEPAPQSVVWGMEQPELLMTESLATHDLRIKRDMSTGTARYDQYRIPQGSLFLEFFCPRTTDVAGSQHAQGVSPKLYTAAANVASGLNLARLSNGFPVWRVYISGPQTIVAPATKKSPLEIYNDTARKHALTYQLRQSNYLYEGTLGTPGTLVSQADQAALDSGLVFDRYSPGPLLEPKLPDARVLVFASGFAPDFSNCPGVAEPWSQVFVSQTPNVRVQGGQYLVVGPREVTYFGSKTSAWDPVKPVNHPSNHRIDLQSGPNTWAQMYRTDNVVVSKGNAMRPSFNMIAACRAPDSWITHNNGANANDRVDPVIGLNLSEPLATDTNYYRIPTTRLNVSNKAPTDPTDPDNNAVGFGDLTYHDAYHDYQANANPPALVPFDKGQAMPPTTSPTPLDYWLLGQNSKTQAVNVGTQEDWSTAYLQRLADPDKPWNATFNPYITVDWIPIDLTVFSGEENFKPDVYPNGVDIKFASRQKTGQSLTPTTVTTTNGNKQVYYYQPSTNPTTPVSTGNTFYSAATHPPRKTSAITPLVGKETFFSYEMYMDDNNPVRPSLVGLPSMPTDTIPNDTFTTLGFLNSTYQVANIANSSLPGDPRGSSYTNWVPDALYWANRTFANPYELANVPISSPGQLMQEFSPASPLTTDSRYRPKFSMANPLTLDATSIQPSGHLLSFFRESSIGTTREIPISTLFEMVETVSPWADANDYADPRGFAYKDPSVFNANWAPVVASTNSALSILRAPYNRISRYVEPGRVNLNTVAEQNVLQGLWFNALTPNERITISTNGTMTKIATDFQDSRRGYQLNAAPGYFNVNSLNSEIPTQFAGVFKPSTEANYQPATRVPFMSMQQASNAPAQVTLMREDHNSANAGQPLFRDTTQIDGVNVNFAQRNAFTDSHPISRLANLTTNRSNVFAVYVTIGFFNYDSATGGLEQEFGADKGQTHRYKAFYVIDRSIPVGFQTGENHNIEKTILLRRFLKTDDR